MPVMMVPLADPTDYVLQGESLRSLALAAPVDDCPGLPVPLLLGGTAGCVSPQTFVPNDGDTLPIIGNDWSLANAPHESQARLSDTVTLPRANNVICTPQGAIIPFTRVALLPLQQTAPMSAQQWVVQGVTRDEAGVPLGGCRVLVLEVGRLAVDGSPVVNETVSDGAGNYSDPVPGNMAYQVIAYKPGSPDVAGITRADVVPDPNG